MLYRLMDELFVRFLFLLFNTKLIRLFVVAHGQLLMDQSALTGESLPVKKQNGDEILSGSICKQGEAQAISMFFCCFI